MNAAQGTVLGRVGATGAYVVTVFDDREPMAITVDYWSVSGEPCSPVVTLLVDTDGDITTANWERHWCTWLDADQRGAILAGVRTLLRARSQQRTGH